MNDKKISIIILNWNGKDDTLECLASVRQIDYPNYETIVVDNGSSDDSVTSIKRKYSEVTVLETGENLGFAGGNNVGIRHALSNKADFIFLLNNDTIVDNQILNNFMSAADSMEQGGIFGGKIYYFSEPGKIWYAGGKWLSDEQKFIHVGMDSIDNGEDFNSITETDYACGCTFFVKTEVLNNIGLLDEKFYLLFEETDLCYRARNSGYKCFFVPKAKVWHKVSTSFGGESSPLYIYYYMRNKLLWAEKNLPTYSRLLVYRQALSFIIRHSLPPRLHFTFSKVLTARGFSVFCVDYINSFTSRLKDPARRANIWAVRDYCLRRFGNCPAEVRSL